MQIDPVIIAVLGSVITMLGTIIGTTWRVRAEFDKRDAALIKMITDHELSDVIRFAKVEASIHESSERLSRTFGETGAAIREKVREVEIWSRDNFVPTSMFEREIDQLSSKVDVYGAMQHLSAKLDKKTSS